MNQPENFYRQLIANGIQTLPANALLEIATFVYFVRQKCLTRPLFEEELYRDLLSLELQSFNQTEVSHLEQEFMDYEQRYPYE